MTELTAGDEAVYIGDSYSDGGAAESADQVFARRRLAQYLLDRGLEFEWFDDFYDMVGGLSS